MNFIIWLLKRLKRKVFGDNWDWLHKYRCVIQEEIALALVVTFFFGILWTFILGLVCLYFIEDREILQTTMKCVMACPPLFFVYNWFYNLYEIYEAERMAVWETLKEPE